MYKGFTLIELIIVIIIIAILVAFALPQFAVTKERALDKEARAALALIQAAEKVYKMEAASYYPIPAGTTSDITGVNGINAQLRLSLPASSPTSTWIYSVDSASLPQRATVTRNNAGARVWKIEFPSGSSEIPCCIGADCPPGSAC